MKPLRIVPPDEPAELAAELPYKRGESASEIAHRLRNGIKRRPLYISEAERP